MHEDLWRSIHPHLVLAALLRQRPIIGTLSEPCISTTLGREFVATRLSPRSSLFQGHTAPSPGLATGSIIPLPFLYSVEIAGCYFAASPFLPMPFLVMGNMGAACDRSKGAFDPVAA